jgi:hypothetical protein
MIKEESIHKKLMFFNVRLELPAIRGIILMAASLYKVQL